MPEAHRARRDPSEPAERPAGELAVDVERTEDHLPVVLGGDVAGEQHVRFRDVHRDAAVGVTGRRDDPGTDLGEQLVVVQLAVDPAGRCVGQVTGDGGVQRPLQSRNAAATDPP